MPEISRSATFGKLGPLAYKAIEGATVFCKLRGNPYVELQHWIAQILQAPDSDLHRIVKHYGLDASLLAADLQQSLDRLPRGASAVTDLSRVPHATPCSGRRRRSSGCPSIRSPKRSCGRHTSRTSGCLKSRRSRPNRGTV
jgi:hypothetical protein